MDFRRRAAALLTLALGALLTPARVWAAPPALDACRRDVLEQKRAYVPAFFGEDGTIAPADLDAVIQGLRAAHVDRDTQVVLLVHGFNADCGLVARDYDRIARLLNARGPEHAGHFVLVGAHWPSDPGPMQDWLPKMAAYRFTTGLGFPSPVSNPYRQKARIAVAVGRRGIRTLLFRIQDAFPGAPTSLWAHSMGSECVVRALAPATRFAGEAPGPTDEPERDLHVASVVLAGADLDQDVFTERSRSSAKAALRCADLWWITVAKPTTADAALEIRRGAGRKDAIGNRGLTLGGETLDHLVARHALVMDDEEIPIFHEMKNYYNAARIRRLRASLEYLRGARTGPAASSLLASLFRQDGLSPDQLAADERASQLAVRIAARWKLGSNLSRSGVIHVLRGKEKPREEPDAPSAGHPSAPTAIARV